MAWTMYKYTQRLRFRINDTLESYKDLLENTEETGSDTTTPSKIRSIKKRSAPFGFIGTISKALLGKLSKQDAQNYEEKFSKLKTGQVKIADLTNEKMHLLIQETLYNKRKIDTIRMKVNKHLSLLNRTWNIIKGLSETSVILHYKSIIDSAYRQVEDSLDWHQQENLLLTNIIKDARHGQFIPALLKKIKLQEIIRQVSDLHPEYEFPVPINHVRVEKLIDLAKVNLHYYKN